MKKNRLDCMRDAHGRFLKSLEEHIVGEMLVGGTVYCNERDLEKDSDLDVIIVAEKEKIHSLLSTKYLKGSLDNDLALKAFDEGMTDYWVVKTGIEDEALSADIITPEFFSKMCNWPIKNEKVTVNSSKFGRSSQENSYPSIEFSGESHIITKENRRYGDHWIIHLPLFFMFDKGDHQNYGYGIPTVKLLTNAICRDWNGFLENNLNLLYGNIVSRLVKEYPSLDKEEYSKRFMNILIKKDKMPQHYQESLKEKIGGFIQ